MAKRYVTIHCIEDLMRKYRKLGGKVCDEAVPGSLGYGTTIMTAPGYKSAVVQEHYENEWSSCHTLRFYNVLPKKYQQLVDEYDNIVEERGW